MRLSPLRTMPEKYCVAGWNNVTVICWPAPFGKSNAHGTLEVTVVPLLHVTLLMSKPLALSEARAAVMAFDWLGRATTPASEAASTARCCLAALRVPRPEIDREGGEDDQRDQQQPSQGEDEALFALGIGAGSIVLCLASSSSGRLRPIGWAV